MSFYVYETGETITADHRPVVIITSNNEKELPDAFLRRCFFHYIDFPDQATMREIVDVHFPNLQADLVDEALKVFYGLREVKGLKKPPSTSELVDWISLLMADELGEGEGKAVAQLSHPTESLPPMVGALLKNESDVSLLEKLGFMLRRSR